MNGWERSGIWLPLDTIIRARGYTVGGQYNGSSWFVESMIGRPGISLQPASRTNNAGTTTTFAVDAVGARLSASCGTRMGTRGGRGESLGLNHRHLEFEQCFES